MTMKMKYAITSFAALALVAAGSMYAGTASAEDTMKAETPAQDHMKGDAMKGDHMKGEAMKGDAMKAGLTGDNAMGGPQK
jgi:pentapeptide MXKDX repeat protein